MTTRLSAVLAMAFCAAAATGHCDDWDTAQAADAPSPRAFDSTAPGTTSPYPERWCIRTFIAESRAARPAIAAHTRSPLSYAYALSTTDELLAAVDSEYVDNSSLYSRLKTLRSLRLMTLWRGRDSALVLGIDDHGILGFSLDEAGE